MFTYCLFVLIHLHVCVAAVLLCYEMYDEGVVMSEDDGID